MSKLSIVIPIFNEVNNIVSLLKTLLERTKHKHHEILLIDGGSTDDTVNVVSNYISTFNRTQNENRKRCVDQLFGNEKHAMYIQLFQSEKGRAKQMNFGAQKATGSILYFLHADTFPPKHFDEFILKKINAGHQAGCFRMRFNSYHPLLLVSQFFTRFNYSWCRGGDQSLFIETSLFQSLAGFDENYIIYEDCEFIHRLYEKNEFTIIPKSVQTSARKYREQGTWKLQYHFAIIHIKKSKGATPEELYAYYKKHVAS
ncbi:MAG: TIGR04283 family arsenosugar biosynthesis glycosyltransferase [Kordia sp.]|uniref:TIGR04283 family arsenosugar biosynthesis glycosyltransferase n=1 Tax=Kordia sp. TaxID=1965332 RepID=UPI003859AC2F